MKFQVANFLIILVLYFPGLFIILTRPIQPTLRTPLDLPLRILMAVRCSMTTLVIPVECQPMVLLPHLLSRKMPPISYITCVKMTQVWEMPLTLFIWRKRGQVGAVRGGECGPKTPRAATFHTETATSSLTGNWN